MEGSAPGAEERRRDVTNRESGEIAIVDTKRLAVVGSERRCLGRARVHANGERPLVAISHGFGPR